MTCDNDGLEGEREHGWVARGQVTAHPSAGSALLSNNLRVRENLG